PPVSAWARAQPGLQAEAHIWFDPCGLHLQKSVGDRGVNSNPNGRAPFCSSVGGTGWPPPLATSWRTAGSQGGGQPAARSPQNLTATSAWPFIVLRGVSRFNKIVLLFLPDRSFEKPPQLMVEGSLMFAGKLKAGLA